VPLFIAAQFAGAVIGVLLTVLLTAGKKEEDVHA
jgi:glycerol uptake facilitator-like aquaporin